MLFLKWPYFMPGFFFADDDPGGGGDDPPEDDPEDEDEIEEEEDFEDEDEDDEYDSEEARKFIRKLRRIERRLTSENKSLKQELKEFKDREKEEEQAELDEIDRLRNENEELQSEVQDLVDDLKKSRMRRAIEAEAHKLGFNDPADAYSLIMASDGDKIKVDEESGKVSGHTDLLETLAEEKPYLVGSADERSRTPRREKGKSREKPSSEDIDLDLGPGDLRL